MSKVSRVIIFILLIFMAASHCLQVISVNGERLSRELSSYPVSGKYFSLNEVAADKENRVLDKLLEYTQQHNAFTVRRDYIFSEVDGGVAGYRFGVFGDPTRNSATVELDFLGTKILSADKYKTLLSAPPEKTLGVDKAKADSLGELPQVLFGPRVTAMQLRQLVTISGTAKGNYWIAGISDTDFKELISNLSKTAELPADSLTKAPAHSAATASLLPVVGISVLAITFILITIILVLQSFQSFKEFGTYQLLGWSKSAFLIKYLKPIVFGAAIISLALALSLLIAFNGFAYTPRLIGEQFAFSLLYFFLSLLTLIPTAIIFYLTQPIAAIRNRVSLKPLLVFLLLLFISTSAIFTVGVRALDGPLSQVQQAETTKRLWQKYSDLQILHTTSVGNDEATFHKYDGKYAADLFKWYKSIAEQPGAYFAYTSFYDSGILKTWKNGAYKHVPEREFWLMQYSPNYLERIDFKVSADDVNAAKSGARVYYLPDTYSENERKNMESWLIEDASKLRESKLETEFTKNPKFVFKTYKPNSEVFTWDAKSVKTVAAKDPVIFVATPENFTPFESESLNAIGLENSRIKLTKTAADKFTSGEYLAKYELSDNKLTFLPVNDFIAGLQKNISTFIAFFGGIFLMVASLQVVLLVAIVNLFTRINAESVAVKRLLGYPVMAIYAFPLITVFAVDLLMLILSVLIRTNVGISSTIAITAVQLLVFTIAARVSVTKEIANLIKRV